MFFYKIEINYFFDFNCILCQMGKITYPLTEHINTIADIFATVQVSDTTMPNRNSTACPPKTHSCSFKSPPSGDLGGRLKNQSNFLHLQAAQHLLYILLHPKQETRQHLQYPLADQGNP